MIYEEIVVGKVTMPSALKSYLDHLSEYFFKISQNHTLRGWN
jgi:hypothetical protein